MAERIQSFESRLERALDRVRIILETTRSPQYANDVPHTYDDKYFLAEYLTNCGLAAQSCVLNLLGVDSANLATLRGWAKNRTVSLQLSSEQVCKFVKKTTRQVESDTEHVTTTKILGITAATTSSKVVSTVDEWFWDLTATYRISAFPGTEASGGALLRKGEGTHQLCTLSERTPHPEIVSFPAIQVNITWLLQQIDDQGAFQFSIDRSVDSCRTPRRNTDVQGALDFFSSLASWFSRVNDFFRSNQFSRQEQASLQMSAINGADLFVPILPLFEEEAPRTDDDDASSSTASSSSSDAASSSSSSSSFLVPVGKSTIKGDVVLPVGDVSRFLAEQRRSIEERFAEFSRLFPRDGKLITELEAQICALAQHGSSIASVYSGAVDYIEQMLYKQLNSAIGKEVSPTDFADYMRFHNRKLFRERYEPRPFCHAVRRPDHYPEGVISIEATTSGLPEPILTSVRAVEPVHPMTFALDAATNVTFRGERFLHSWINHSFSGASGLSLALTARARQFSSFILLVGRVASATVFEPTGAIIIQNKDDLKIPLLLEQIPTPKEFQDAIDSLSPEQQRFARAYRDMQLQSTLFAVCVIQIKPQLEKLLRLPDDALTKEIRLTQDLLELFIKYQIPSDLLSYDGREDASLASKLDTVRDYVAGLRKMIDEKKDDELTDAAQNALFGALDPTVSPRSVSQPIGGGGGGGIWVPDGSGSSRGGSFLHALSSRTSRSRSGVVAGDQSVAASSRVKPERPVEQPKQLDGDSSVFDFTAIPQRLDRQFAALDIDSALRPTIIKAEKSWTRTRQPTLLSSPSTATLTKQQRKTEKSQAFDLLDALSRSGSLPFDDVSFHVVLAATHCFTKSVTDTVIVDNVNPIEKVERSILIVSQTVHERPAAELVNESQLSRVQQASPILFSSST